MDPHQSIIALYLDAPLQSWGYQSRFDHRTSFSMPTRSGVLGMICAALGIDRSQSSDLANFQNLDLTILVFGQHHRLVDFHTVGGGWNKKTHPMNMVAKPGKSADTVVTRREYLQGAKFGAILQGPADLITKIKEGLEHPVWGIWLGRKSCIPATPVCQGIFNSFNAAEDHLSRLAGKSPIRRLREVDRFEDGTDSLNDIPLDFHNRIFAMRRVCSSEE